MKTHAFYPRFLRQPVSLRALFRVWLVALAGLGFAALAQAGPQQPVYNNGTIRFEQMSKNSEFDVEELKKEVPGAIAATNNAYLMSTWRDWGYHQFDTEFVSSQGPKERLRERITNLSNWQGLVGVDFAYDLMYTRAAGRYTGDDYRIALNNIWDRKKIDINGPNVGISLFSVGNSFLHDDEKKRARDAFAAGIFFSAELSREDWQRFMLENEKKHYVQLGFNPLDFNFSTFKHMRTLNNSVGEYFVSAPIEQKEAILNRLILPKFEKTIKRLSKKSQVNPETVPQLRDPTSQEYALYATYWNFGFYAATDWRIRKSKDILQLADSENDFYKKARNSLGFNIVDKDLN